MKFFSAVSVLLVAMARPSLAMPSANPGLSPIVDSPNLVARAPGDEPTTTVKIPGSDDTTQYMTWLTDQGELNWNLLAQDAVKVSGQIMSSIDLNTMVEDMLRQIANYVRYFAKGMSPVDAILEMMFSVVKALLAKVSLNTLVQMSMSVTGYLVSAMDFDSAMRIIFEFLNGMI
ncbi:uncharacterized protein NECHADRAFT_82767 [Fusarium vanettenii 77-13-4]|uniref:Uncharacterized protein n=1 Tax=Fusarium vanettenii (strain ATCC MYA-4622 / CBS 123669 / FGSC 9596 / NRRL 45880 / 77-13-4) TaxID=660122 RepID=C7YWS5_FUSV7|nr:uncharacterized protein NECHADRAFT_82767 [Fusarium vanettenii 77-13-4]EEU43457.1 hypothetical protein NECHADRAFT_82767 [Fusarium vanettenii 77-13-4]